MTSLIAVLVVLGLQQSAPAPGQAPPPCAVSDDPTYAFTRENPVPIGGGALYVAARERRYMDALRGPAGQAIRYKRVGSLPQSTSNSTILDLYEVTYEGLEKPISLYLDAYHYWEQRAPKGFICAQPMNLQPIIDTFRAMDSLKATALEQGATREFAPIPLDTDGPAVHGVVFDGFRTLAVASRAAASAGKSATAKPGDYGSVVVAYPLTCEGRTVAPVTIELTPAQGPPLLPKSGVVKDAAIGALLPGVSVPAGSVAAPFQLGQLTPAYRVQITYSEAACPQGSTQVLLPFKFAQARPADFSEPPLPEGANPAERRLLLQVLIDLDGKLQQATYVGGPRHLEQAAIGAVKTWRAEPATVNGSAVPTATLVEVRFK